MKLAVGSRVTRFGKPQLGVGTVVEITEGPQPHYVVEWGVMPGWVGFHPASHLRSERYWRRNVMRDDVCADLFVQRARGESRWVTRP